MYNTRYDAISMPNADAISPYAHPQPPTPYRPASDDGCWLLAALGFASTSTAPDINDSTMEKLLFEAEP